MGPVLLSTRTTIVVPCYNEANRLNLRAFAEFLTEIQGVRIIFVDDGSQDETGSKIRAFASQWRDWAFCFSLPSNLGKAEAVRTGIQFALAEYEQEFVGFWDADLATPLNSIRTFIGLLETSSIDIVVGSRVKLCGRHIDRKPARHYLGRVFATVVSTMLGLAIYDTQCGAKLFRVTDEIRDVFSTPFRSRWVFDVEILARLLQTNTVSELEAKLYEYPLENWRDVAGSKVKTADFLAAIFEVFAIHSHYMHTAKDSRRAGKGMEC